MSYIERLNLLCPLFELSFKKGSTVLCFTPLDFMKIINSAGVNLGPLSINTCCGNP